MEERQIDTGAAGDVEAGRTAETGSTYAHLWAFYTLLNLFVCTAVRVNKSTSGCDQFLEGSRQKVKTGTVFSPNQVILDNDINYLHEIKTLD